MSAEILICSCCGKGIEDTPEQNTVHGQVPYPHDTGFGMCVECGGDKTIGNDYANMTEEQFKKRLGWGMKMFYDARIEILQEKLSEENAEKFKALSYQRKCAIIAQMVEKGYMI